MDSQRVKSSLNMAPEEPECQYTQEITKKFNRRVNGYDNILQSPIGKTIKNVMMEDIPA